MNYQVREADLIQSDVAAYLQCHEAKDMLRFLTCGSVDDGKSTLIGRLLYDSKMIYEDQLASVLKDSKTHGTTGHDFDPALLTDGLKAEREQGITIDVAYRYFSTDKRSFIICDAPGHEQYTRNMATGASHCDLAIILIDARHGVMPQTRRHSFIASLLGIKHFVVAINKMDSVGYNENIYRCIRQDYEGFVSKLQVNDVHFLPISALHGDNVVDSSVNMPWFKGEPLLNYLEEIPISIDRNLIDFRFPVQYVIRPDQSFRGFAGNIVSGVIHKGDEIVVLPSGARTKINRIVTFDGDLDEAFAPQSVTLTTTDEVDISRGCFLAKPNNVPEVGNNFDAMLVWMHETKLESGKNYLLRASTQTVPVTVSSIQYKFDINNLKRQDVEDGFFLNDIGRVQIISHRSLCYDAYNRNRKTGSFVLIDPILNNTVAAGMILEQSACIQDKSKIEPISKNINIETSKVTLSQRQNLFGHLPSTLWLTGLSGSGKSSIAQSLEKMLIEQGVKVCILDGDNIRHGINKDLGFSSSHRSENIRRVAEIAKLMNEAGLFVITAFITPRESDRKLAKQILGDWYVEAFVNTPLEVCEKRDPKGLYAKARAGIISGFTGIDSEYEMPTNPDLTISTDGGIEETTQQIIRKVNFLIKI
jgi:bifunctional enzyme CysN/CysC